MYHSIEFYISGPWHPTRPSAIVLTLNTWNDLRLIPTERPVIAPPEVETQYEESPIADGSYDLTDLLTGSPKYKYREGSIKFMVDHANFQFDQFSYNWVDVYSTISNTLHGQYVRLVLEDDPLYFYEGRVFIDKWECDQHCSYITISYKLKPDKQMIGRGGQHVSFNLF